ncbi:MAG: hypothetical protein H7Y04_04745 [Verrucomicrobia bacterium]|nr:hypothetical protein [Cytophagales bacterium]
MKENNIEYILEDNSPSLDATYGNTEFSHDFRVKLRKQDFEKADALLLNIYTNQWQAVEEDYYLLDFTDEELLEIITKRDEWNQFDYLLAQKLLKERGKEINPEVVSLLRKQRIKALAKTEESQKALIYMGYYMGILGGFLGIFIGWHLLKHKKTLPNGDVVYAYSLTDRKHGNRMVIIGVIFLLFWCLIRILQVNLS